MIIKGGALLSDTRRFLEAWDLGLPPEENLCRISKRWLLGKTQARQRDVVEVLRRRFVDPGEEIIATLRVLLHDPTGFREACYYEAARTDALLASFAAGPLFTWYSGGQRQITVQDVDRWLVHDSRVPLWGVHTRRRVARGLLATLRDFGILNGAVGGRRKQIVAPHLSVRGFLYVAFRERSQRESARAVLEATAWRWYLITPEMVRGLFLEADRLGYVRFSEAGSITRVDWLLEDLREIADVVAS